VAVAALAVAWFFVLRPQFLGGPAAYVVVSGMSMEPTLHSGDLVVAQRERRYRVGDVVLYHVPKGETGAGALIIHRIVGGSAASGWIVQGDNKEVPDLWRPGNSDIVGAMWGSVSGVGTGLARATSPLVLASISTLLALLLGLPRAAGNAADARTARRTLRAEREPDESLATALTLIGPPSAPPPVSAPESERAPRPPSRALMLPLQRPALTVAPLPLVAFPAVVPQARQLALPPARIAARDVPSRSGAWGEAEWTARDLIAVPG
jgi:signal peptidase